MKGIIMPTHETTPLSIFMPSEESLQETFDAGWYSDSTPYQPEVRISLTEEQLEKIGREVLYRTTGNHEDPDIIAL